MNPYIKQQLEKCTSVYIPEYDDNTTEIVIPKAGTVKIPKEYEVGCLYQIYVSDELVSPCNWYSTIHGNWNKGIGPKQNILNIRVEQIMGKMIRIDSVDIDNNSWSGWLPKSNIKKLKDL